jgi:hypothetical protein
MLNFGGMMEAPDMDEELMKLNETPENDPFALLMDQIENFKGKAERYRDQAKEEGDVDEADKRNRVYMVLRELERLGRCFEGQSAENQKKIAPQAAEWESSVFIGAADWLMIGGEYGVLKRKGVPQGELEGFERLMPYRAAKPHPDYDYQILRDVVKDGVFGTEIFWRKRL